MKSQNRIPAGAYAGVSGGVIAASRRECFAADPREMEVDKEHEREYCEHQHRPVDDGAREGAVGESDQLGRQRGELGISREQCGHTPVEGQCPDCDHQGGDAEADGEQPVEGPAHRADTQSQDHRE